MIPSTLRLLDSEPEATSPVVAGVDWKLEENMPMDVYDQLFARKAERPEARARRETKAKRVCDVCPVFDECRSIARANCEYGYWAGESEEDRHVLGFRVSAPIGLRARLADLEKRQNKSA